MITELSTKVLKEVFWERAKNKYEAVENQTLSRLLQILSESQNLETDLLRIKRNGYERASFKTLVFAAVDKEEDFRKVFSCVASIKEEVLDPESSDLYFVGTVKDRSISNASCTQIESTEQFCRKYILRPDESLDGLLDRTFLSDLTSTAFEQEIVDPLLMALQQTAERMPVFGSGMQDRWYSLLRSGLGGADLIEALFGDNKKDNQDGTTGENNHQ